MRCLITMFLVSIFFTASGQFHESFEGSVFPPPGWVSFRGQNNLGVNYDWTQTSAAFNTGGHSAFIRYENVTGGLAEDWLVTPSIPVTGSTFNLNYFQKQEYATNYGTIYTVRISLTSQTDINTFTIINSEDENSMPFSMTSKNIDLSAYIGQSVFIAFVMTNDDGDNWYVDDVSMNSSVETPLQQTLSQDDWTLPGYVTKTNNAGIIFGLPFPVNYPDPDIAEYNFRWKDVEPADNVFDWSIISSALTNAANSGKQICLRPDLSDSMHVPAWLFTKYPGLSSKDFYVYPGGAGQNVYYDNYNQNSPGRFVALWDNAVMTELANLLNSFKAQNFAANSALHHSYFPGCWFFGEYQRPDDQALICVDP